MKHLLKTPIMALFALLALSAPALAQSVDETVNEIFANSTGWFVSLIFSNFPGTTFPWIVGWLVIAATVFTLYFGFVQLRWVGHSIALVKGDYSDPNDAGEVSHFQALATALSGTVGLGNIAGVAVAIGIGGPGATFWMILAGLLGMASKFTECTLGVKYRNEYPDGKVSGGPMYYLSKGCLTASPDRIGIEANLADSSKMRTETMTPIASYCFLNFIESSGRPTRFSLI